MKKREKNGVVGRTDVRNKVDNLQGYYNYRPIRYDVCARDPEYNVTVKENERESRARLLAENGGTYQ
jgi:hypothetical protein